MGNQHPAVTHSGGRGRVPDTIKRGRLRFLYSLFVDEFKEDIWKALLKCLKHKDARINLILIQELADRLEGRPVQPHEITEKRSTTFTLADGTVILRDGAAAAEGGEEREAGDDGWRPAGVKPPEPPALAPGPVSP